LLVFLFFVFLGLADEAETVRATALRAGQMVVTNYAYSSIEVHFLSFFFFFFFFFFFTSANSTPYEFVSTYQLISFFLFCFVISLFLKKIHI
jgi:hypothetical protein